MQLLFSLFRFLQPCPHLTCQLQPKHTHTHTHSLQFLFPIGLRGPLNQEGVQVIHPGTHTHTRYKHTLHTHTHTHTRYSSSFP